MRKIGREQKDIDYSTFESLCKIQCTRESIAAFFEIDGKTLDRLIKRQYGEPFSKVFARKRFNGGTHLRQKQFEVAMKGNVTMLIWLGKNILKQSDRTEVDMRTESTGPILPTQVVITLPDNGFNDPS